MTGRVYTVSSDVDAATTADDIIELDAAAEKPIAVLGWYLSQSTELGDAAEEGIRYAWVRGNTTSGSGGASVTPRPVNISDAAAGFTTEMNNTTAASAGTAVNLFQGAWNLRYPDLVWLPEGCEMTTSGTVLLCLRLLAAPTDSTSFALTVWVREDG
jgi:hypothetical protein